MYHPRFMQLLSTLALILIISGSAFAWDFSYEGDVLPTDPSLGSNVWKLTSQESDASMATVQDGALRILDESHTKNIGFYRDAVWATTAIGAPLTAEARVKVLSAQSYESGYTGPVKFGLHPMGGYINVFLWTNSMTVWAGNGIVNQIAGDFTQYRTIRVARDHNNQVKVWLDGSEVFSAVTTEYHDGMDVWFGQPGSWIDVTSESYWDYVRYSTDYMPVPEPSSLLVMAGGLVPICGALIRRRRQA